MKGVEAVLRMFDPRYSVRAIVGRRRIKGNSLVQAREAIP
jgi:hypothetical protein